MTATCLSNADKHKMNGYGKTSMRSISFYISDSHPQSHLQASVKESTRKPPQTKSANVHLKRTKR